MSFKEQIHTAKNTNTNTAHNNAYQVKAVHTVLRNWAAWTALELCHRCNLKLWPSFSQACQNYLQTISFESSGYTKTQIFLSAKFPSVFYLLQDVPLPSPLIRTPTPLLNSQTSPPGFMSSYCSVLKDHFFQIESVSILNLKKGVFTLCLLYWFHA